MAVLTITEYTQAGNDAGAQAIQAGQYPANAKQSVAIQSSGSGGSSQNSLPFSPGTRFIRVNSDITCWIDIGYTPLAVVNYDRLPLLVTEYFMVIPGQMIAVLAT